MARASLSLIYRSLALCGLFLSPRNTVVKCLQGDRLVHLLHDIDVVPSLQFLFYFFTVSTDYSPVSILVQLSYFPNPMSVSGLPNLI